MWMIGVATLYAYALHRTSLFNKKNQNVWGVIELSISLGTTQLGIMSKHQIITGVLDTVL